MTITEVITRLLPYKFEDIEITTFIRLLVCMKVIKDDAAVLTNERLVEVFEPIISAKNTVLVLPTPKKIKTNPKLGKE